ncbi:hypothetical protein Tco_1117221, partial [Tanacetum coccineum]
MLVGPNLQAACGLDLTLNKVVEMISCTNKSKPLALPWGRTPRLDYDVRVRKHIVRGESSTTVSLYFAYNHSGRSETLVGQGSVVIMNADADYLSRMLTNPLLACGRSLFFDFANFQIPLSQFLIDVLKYFRINLSQLSVIAIAKVSYFEILCRIHGYLSTVGLFYSLKHWNDSFFLVDASIFLFSVPWHTKKTLVRDPPLTAVEFSAEACDFLATHQAPFQKFPKPFLCLVGLSRYYELDDNVYPTFLTDAGEEMDLFAFIRHADPTKVRISERRIEEGHVSLLESTKGRVVPLAGGNKQGGQNDKVEVTGPHDLNEEGDDDIQAGVADKPKGTRKKRKAASGASGSNLPPKKLREDHDTSGDADASTAGKSLVALQDLLDHRTLAVEVGVTASATVHFVTYSVTLTLEREGGGHTDFVFRPNLRTHHPAERFVISSDSSHHSSTNAADVEVTSIVRSSILPPPVMTTVVAAIAVVGTSSAPVFGAGIGPIIQSLFADSASPSATGLDPAGPSNPRGTKLSADTFYVCRSMVDQLAPPRFFSQLCGMDYDQLFAEFNVWPACQTCLSAKVRLRSEHNLRERKKFERKCTRQTNLLKEKDAEIASLKSQLSLKEAEAAEAICLRSKVSIVKATKAARVNELNNLKERNLALEGVKSTLEGQVTTLESAAASKDTELASVNTQVAKLNHDLYSLQLS